MRTVRVHTQTEESSSVVHLRKNLTDCRSIIEDMSKSLSEILPPFCISSERRRCPVLYRIAQCKTIESSFWSCYIITNLFCRMPKTFFFSTVCACGDENSFELSESGYWISIWCFYCNCVSIIIEMVNHNGYSTQPSWLCGLIGKAYKKQYRNVLSLLLEQKVAVIRLFWSFCEIPSNLEARASTWSSYKHCESFIGNYTTGVCFVCLWNLSHWALWHSHNNLFT